MFPKLKRVGKWVGTGLGALLSLVVVGVAAALLALQTSWAQQRLAKLISEQANAALQGRVEVTIDGSLSLFGLSKVSVRLLPGDIHDNAPLVELSNVRASWDLWSLVESLVGSGPLVVGIHHVEVESLFVDLRSDVDGNLALVEAVALKDPSDPQPESTGPSPFVNLEGLDIFGARVLLPQVSADPDAATSLTPSLRPPATIDRIHATFDMRNGMAATVSLSAIEAPIPGQPSVFFGDLAASAYMDEDDVPTANARVAGELDGLPVTVEAVYHDERWVARVNADGSSTEWRAATPGFEPTSAIGVAVSAVGDLDSALAEAKVSAGSARVHTALDVAFNPLTVDGALSLLRADPRAFAEAAPTGKVNVAGDFSFRAEPQSATVQIAVRDSALEGNAIPDFDLRAGAVSTERADFELKATDDSGLQLKGHLVNGPEALSFNVQGQAKHLPEYPGAPQLSAFEVQSLTLDAQGRLQRQPQTLDASLRLFVDRIAIPSAKLEVADLSAQVNTSGPLAQPELDANIVAHAVRVGNISASHLRLQAGSTGPGRSTLQATTRVRLTKDAPLRDVSVRTKLTSFSPLTARDALLTIATEKQTLSASVGKLEAGDRTVIDDIRVSGVGDLTGDIASRGNTFEARVQTNAFDLGAVSELFSPLVPKLTGKVTANLGVKTTGQRLTQAHAFTRMTNVGTETARADQVEASLVVKEDALSGTISVSRERSQVRFDASNIDLARLLKAARQDVSGAGMRAQDFRGYVVTTVNAHSRDFPEVERALGEIHTAGVLQSQLIIEQRDDLPLRINALVRLRDVDLRKVEPAVPRVDAKAPDRAPDPEAAEHGAGWEIVGLTAEWMTTYDGSTGKCAGTLVVSEHDRRVPIAQLALATVVQLDQLNAQLASLVPNLPIEGSLVVPLAPLDSLPGGSFLPSGVEASVAANVELRGTPSAPLLDGSLQVKDLQVSASNNSFPVSITVAAQASKEAVKAHFELTHDTLVLANGKVDGSPSSNDWRAVAKIDELPLGKVPYLRDYGVTGLLSANLTFDSGANSPSVTADVQARDIRAYGETIPKMTVHAKLEGGRGELRTDIEQRSGRALLTAWANSATGQLADYRPTKVRLETRSFQIRPLLVAMQGSVSDLSGNLDGVVEVAFEPGNTQATGQIELSDGLVLIPALGKQVHDIGLTVRAAPGKLELSRLQAKVERGEIWGKGKLTYTPQGRFVAELNLDLPEDKRLPIANKGRDVAEASGRIDVNAVMAPNEETKIDVNVPELDVYFSDSATDKVMSSESPSFVTLGTYLPDGHYLRYVGAQEAQKSTEKSAAPSKPTRVTVNLGKKVWLHHGTSTFAGIDGQLEAQIGETTRLMGSLNLAEGRIDIQGRVFDIKPGTVVFHGESPPNPDVVAEAAWTSPSGYTVIATYRGSVSNGKVVLRSEPPLSYGEILNVLLFDDPEGSGGSDGSPGAGDVAATVASAGLSRSLTSLTDLDIQASMDTDAAGSPRPELGVRLSPRLAVEVAYVMEASAALSQPPDRAFVSFDWRLSNAWTLETTLGDHGSAAADVTWKYRY